MVFRDVLELSAPHIYLSALPWVRRTSKIAEIFAPWFPNTISLIVQGIEHRQRTLLDLRGHTASVKSVSLQSDCSRIVSGSLDGTIRVWDAETGEEVMKAFKLASNASIYSVSFSPDGKHVVSGSSDNLVRVLAVSTSEVIIEHLVLEGHSAAVTCVAFSPDGKRIASGSLDTTVRMWDAVTGKEISEAIVRHSFGVYSVCFTPSGSHIVSCARNTIQMWDARTGKHIWTRIIYGLTCFSLSPDGEYIIAGSCDAKLRLWNLRDGVMKQLLGHGNDVHSVGFSPDGCYVVSGSKDGTVRIWDTKTGKEVVEALKGHTASVLSVCFLGRRIISGSEDNTIRMWDVDIPIGEETKHATTSHVSTISCVDISPDGTYILSASDDSMLRVMDWKTGNEVMKRHVLHLSSVRFSLDGSRIVSGSFDGCVTVWDAMTGEEIMTLRKGTSAAGAVLCVGFSPDGTRIFAGSRNCAICVWDANTGSEIEELSDNLVGSFSCMEFSPDGNFVVSNSMELNHGRWWPTSGTMAPRGPPPKYVIPLWDVKKGERVISIGTFFATHDYPVNSVCFSPDESQIASGSWNTIQIWDVSTGQEIKIIHDANMSGVNSICFSRGGTCIVSGSDDGAVRVWDARSGGISMKLEAHTSRIRSLRCSADGSQIVSYSEDETIRVWDIRLAEKITGCADMLLKLDHQNNQSLTALNVRLISPPTKTMDG